MRYTAEHRGHENKDEWCLIDEDISPVGTAVAVGMTEDLAILVAKLLNNREQQRKPHV